jgi:hypothetical protein
VVLYSCYHLVLLSEKESYFFLPMYHDSLLMHSQIAAATSLFTSSDFTMP